MTRVLIHRDGPIARVELNRPEKHNGVDFPMIDALIAACRELADDRAIRAVLLHGGGPSFCAGLDVRSVLGNKKAAAWAAAALLKPTANRFQRVNLGWRDLSVPVIAAIHGNCFGAGLQLALGADIRICHPEAQLSVMEAKWGLVPDMGGTVLLREVVGRDVALELTLSAKVVSGVEAAALGLVTRVADDPLAEAHALAEAIASRSPDAVAGGKRLLHEAWEAPEAEALAAERRWQRRMLRGRNQRIAVARNSVREGETPPAWKPRGW